MDTKDVNVNDIIRLNESDYRGIAVITRIVDDYYISCITSDGRVFSPVYVGYIKKTGKTFDIKSVLEQIK